MREIICKKCKAVYITDGVVNGFTCLCDSTDFKVNEIEEVKKRENN